MLSGNGTIDYNVEAHTLDVQETSAARQGSTTRNIHGSITKNFQSGNVMFVSSTIFIYPSIYFTYVM